MVRFIALAVTILLAFALAGCSDDDDEGTASPSPTRPAATAGVGASPTTPAGGSPQAGRCPVAAEVCTFASAIRDAVGRGDPAPIVASAQNQPYTCPGGRPQGLGGPFPLCDGAASGEMRQGFQIAYLASEGVVVNTEGLREAVARWLQAGMASASDQYGSGANKLYTVACPAGILPCGNQFVLVFSQLFSATAGTPRTNLMLYYEHAQPSAQPRLVFVAMGPLLQPGEVEAALKGGAFSGFIVPQGWPPITTFYLLP